MNTKRGFISIVLLVIIAVVVIGAGTYIYTKQKQDTNTPSISSVVNVSVNKNVALKTYTNTKYGFEFQYPSYAKVIDEGTAQIGASLSLVVLAGKERTSSSDEVTLRVYEVESGTELYNEFQDNGDIKIVRGKDFIIQVNPTIRNNSELSDAVEASIKIKR